MSAASRLAPSVEPADVRLAQADGPALRDADFERVRRLIHHRAGISLNSSKRQLVYSRLSRRLRTLGIADFGHYLDRLEAGADDAPEWQQFVNAMTTNLTSFFREAHHFPILADLLRRQAPHGPLRAWCCAASTGEEPYTIAMTALDTLGAPGAPRGAAVSVLATDIDTNVLDTAADGVYAAESVQRLDAALLGRHFLRGTGNRAGLVKVRPELRALVEFRPLNLLAPRWPVTGHFDAIFCRNVMIYFDKPTQERLIERLAGMLAPHGLLFVGHSENFTQLRHVVELQGKTVYRLAAALRR